MIEKRIAGRWVIVANGLGVARYVCRGTTLNTYRANGQQFQANCG
jgi:hypothetical protein